MERIAAVLAVVCVGCVTEVSPRGAPAGVLRLETRVHSEAYLAREQVGQVQYSNGAGQPDGSAAIYANRTHTETTLLWRPLAGDQPIADEDFFRGCGDEPAAKSSQAYRERGRWIVRTGIGAMVLGAAALVVGSVMHQTNVLLGGVAGLTLGPSVAYFGYAYLSPDNHAVPYSRASDDLERYRQAHGLALQVQGRW